MITAALVALIVLKWLFVAVALFVGGFSLVDAFRDTPKLPDPVLAIFNLLGYLALIALAAIVAL